MSEAVPPPPGVVFDEAQAGWRATKVQDSNGEEQDCGVVSKTMPHDFVARKRRARALKEHSTGDMWALLIARKPISSKSATGYYGVSKYKFPSTGFQGFQA